MKTISGSIIASKQTTLSKAASSMNNFLSSKNGASAAVSSYLRQCAAAFNELVQDHKELKSERKHKHKKKKTLQNANVTEENHKENKLDIVERITDLEEEEESVRYPENSGLGSIDEEEKKKMKKKKKRNQIDEIERESGGDAGIEVKEIKEKKKKRKRKKPLDDFEERHTKKKRRHERET